MAKVNSQGALLSVVVPDGLAAINEPIRQLQKQSESSSSQTVTVSADLLQPQADEPGIRNAKIIMHINH